MKSLLLVVASACAVSGTFLIVWVTMPALIVALALSVHSWRIDRADGAALCLLGVSGASVYWSETPDQTEATFGRVVAAMLLFIAVRQAIVTRRNGYGVVLGGLIGCGYLLVRLIRDFDDSQLSLVRTSDSAVVNGLNINYVGYVLSGGIFLISCAIIHVHRRRTFVLISAIPMLYGIHVTGSRGALLGGVLCIAWLLLPQWLQRRSHVLVVGTVLATGIAITVGLLDAALRELFPVSPGVETGQLNGRLLYWPLARELFMQAPFVGHGDGAFLILNPGGVHAHNALLDTAVGLGLVGAVVLSTLVVFSSPPAANVPHDPARQLVLPAYVLAVAPALLTGYWHLAPAFWVITALLSRSQVLTGPQATSAASSGPGGSRMDHSATPDPTTQP